MKMREGFDLNGIAITASFIIAMVVWGIRLEGAVSSNTAAMVANEETRDKVQRVRWEALEFQMDQLRQRISLLESNSRSDSHESWKAAPPYPDPAAR